MKSVVKRCLSAPTLLSRPALRSSSISRSATTFPVSATIVKSSSFSSTPIIKMSADSSATNPKVEETKAAEPLPPLSDHDFRIYNHMAEHMDLYHNHFRQSWTTLWTACTENKRPRNVTLKQFIDEGLRFVESLNLHHSIEERHIFPHLGKRMPEFRGDLQAQHKEIHAGMDTFGDYLRACRKGDREFELPVLKEHMASWGKVLWEHLDDEVRTLGAENMRKYWSKAEMQRMPM